MENNYQIRSVPRMFEEVTKQIIQYIHEEKLESGTKLPPERNLSELLGVSRSSVREGLRILELLKYLESRQGEGTFVAKSPPFLLPLNIIKKETERNELNKYYEIALLHGHQITVQGLKLNSIHPPALETGSGFWISFSKWINMIGEQLGNNYYLELWNAIYLLLNANDYFNTLKTQCDLVNLHQAFLDKNVDDVNSFFESLQKQ